MCSVLIGRYPFGWITFYSHWILCDMDGPDLRIPLRVSDLILATRSGSNGRRQRGEGSPVEARVPSSAMRSRRRCRTPASFRRFLDSGDATTMIRETRRVLLFDPRCRLFLEEERRGGWRRR
jgi:hypothetical protein